MVQTPQYGIMPNDARNNESGRFVSKYDDEEFLDALAVLGEATTREVAEHIGADHDTARRRLNALADGGNVGRRKIAATILWNIPTEERDR